MTGLFQSVKSIEIAVDVAIKLEQYGRDFYQRCFESTKDPGMMTIFSTLAAEEEKHLGLYRQLFERVNEPGTLQQVELVGEYGSYIDLLSGEITRWLDRQPSDLNEILDLALNFEKNTLLIFNELRELFSGSDREAIDEICREEKKHIKMISELRNRQWLT